MRQTWDCLHDIRALRRALEKYRYDEDAARVLTILLEGAEAALTKMER